MKKRYRNEKGQLSLSLDQIKKETASEAAAYYQSGHIYKNNNDNREYLYLYSETQTNGLAHFQSFDGYNLFIPIDALGTFLPDVADEGFELIYII